MTWLPALAVTCCAVGLVDVLCMWLARTRDEAKEILSGDAVRVPDADVGDGMDRSIKALSQYMTPFWAAAELVDRHFRNLTRDDLVLEPSCGSGAFLCAIPGSVPAVGVEIDPVLAEQARMTSGRQVITGDFRTVGLALKPTAVVGNPPFKMQVFDGMLRRCHELLPPGGRAGFLLPAYFLQTPTTVMGLSERWSIQTEMLPRTLFDRLSKPLCFVVFTKDRRRMMIGMALYSETAEVAELRRSVRDHLERSSGTWRAAVEAVMRELGGEADLEEIYHRMHGRQPTENRWWKEKIRQVLQMYHTNVRAGRWKLAA